MQVPQGTTLGQALKASSLVGSGGEAKVLIQAGEVSVNGEVVESERLFTGTAESAVHTGVMADDAGEIELRLHPTRSPDIQVSWIAVVTE